MLVRVSRFRSTRQFSGLFLPQQGIVSVFFSGVGRQQMMLKTRIGSYNLLPNFMLHDANLYRSILKKHIDGELLQVTQRLLLNAPRSERPVE